MKRRRRWKPRVDWFEVVLTALGVLFAVLAVICVVALVAVLGSLGEMESTEGFPTGQGFLQGLKGVGVVLVSVGAVVFSLVAWWLLADRVRAALHRRREEE
jgi:uncharacterized BrkB/YihY/UPF0761 family membrane protein